uniref:Retrotransposable element Tf2 n=1 Tax=Cajanus cajan TaxID=3821 RepID=A0A151S3A9_CAJCA|nr:Retrotransposable element Tf2 [Cajanus cajan]
MPSHVADLAEVFQSLRRHQMRLNPDKCVFCVSGGKFLGFMLSNRGIEANPDKCQAILDMRSPTNLKEVQKLAGRLTSLSRFLPCMAETSKPIIALLKKANRFQWIEECEASFQMFKQRLGTPPILAKRNPGQVVLYLVVSSEAISAVMIQEKDGQQYPIYFISQVLQDAERRYQLLEKVALSLIYAARRLR